MTEVIRYRSTAIDPMSTAEYDQTWEVQSAGAFGLYVSRAWFRDIWERRVGFRLGLIPILHILPGAYEATWGPLHLIVPRRVLR
jgi:hypothetical protein